MKPTDLLPLDYLLSIVRDPKASAERRDWAATTALPYCHPRIISDRLRKKEIREREAKRIAADSPWAKIFEPPSEATGLRRCRTAPNGD